ncbi:MAG: DNA-3-methyladenine glycosylase 2 family protein [Synergistaceae bacterium]|nr:DNA-3-methyladenine glycosylase 2 family protein [Synergistaceae bacterium]
MYFSYTEEELNHLKKRDKRLAAAIDEIGALSGWHVEPDVFSALVHHIVGQQVSTLAQRTVWARILAGLGEVTPENICAAGSEKMQSFGISFRKAEYIMELARKTASCEFDPGELWKLDDEAVIKRLSALRGVGVWTAEMLLIFSMRRRDVLSFGDFGIRRGLRMLYRHREITPALFEKYRKRYSPCGSVASLYLWEVAGGALPALTDPAPGGAKKRRAAAR